MAQLVTALERTRLGSPGRVSLLALALIALAWPAAADDSTGTGSSEPANANMDLARSVAVTGREAFNAGDYETALTLFRRAYTLFPAPTVVLYEARSLEKLGLLVEAVEAYGRTTQIPMQSTAPAQFAEAIAAAREEGRALRGRIPTLTLRLEGVSGNDPNLTVSINGRAIGAAQLGQAQSLNPGTYRIKGSVGNDRSDSSEVVLEPGRNATVVLRLQAPSLTPPAPSTDGESTADTASAGSGSFSTWTLVAASVGVAGLGTGVVTGLMATSKHSEAEAACAQQLCDPASNGIALAEDFRSMRTVSTIGYGVGAAGVAAAVVLWLTTSEPAPASQASALEPWWDAHTAGVRGRF
jgi:hypothetical protein